MNWEAIGATGEVLGAITVVATLFYLASQIRQNTRAQENASRLASTRVFTDWYTSVMSDPELVRIWGEGLRNPSSLNSEDVNRFMWMISAISSRYEEAFTQYVAGLLEEEVWFEYRNVMTSFLHNKLVRYWWDARISPFTNRFRIEIEEAMKEEPSWSLPPLNEEREMNQ